ncbi:MAG: cobalamin-independent methionine synthase II family protein [Planctomycetes bacterium]|nr:cobalamin-independent methionine synthase II family protein [Planctomycetota bacterium]
MALPRFPVTSVGSWPRPDWLLDAMKRKRSNLRELQDQATLLAIKQQEDAGVDLVTDGEQRRDNFYSFLCDKLDGLQLMTMADLLDHVEDKAGFEALLQTLDVPAFAIRNPTVVGKLRAKAPLALDDARFLRAHTKRALKVTLPGPYLLSRSMWVKRLSEAAYPTRAGLIDDLVALLRAELLDLVRMGVEMVQFDEPALTELAFAGKSSTRTFMCAALAAQASPESELELAVELINRVVDGVSGTITAIHVCRGNWSRKEEVLLAGSYDPLMPTFRKMKVKQFVLEYATERAGTLDALRELPPGAQVGLGAVNPRTSEIEPTATIVERARRVAELLDADRVFLNPDCGFGTFAERPVNSAAVAEQKLAALAQAAQLLRR